MILSTPEFMVYTAIVAGSGACIMSLVQILLDRRMGKKLRCCANCTHRMGDACKIDGDNHHEVDCCESWEGQ